MCLVSGYSVVFRKQEEEVNKLKKIIIKRLKAKKAMVVADIPPPLELRS